MGFDVDPKRPKQERFYALTDTDVQNIWSILVAARNAIDELFDYRRVESIEPQVDFPQENEFYRQTSAILSGRGPDLEKIF